MPERWMGVLAMEGPVEINPWYLVIVAALIVAVMVVAVVFFVYWKLWFQAFMSGADVSIISLVGMSFRQVNSRVMVQAKIMAAQAGLDISRQTGMTTARLEAHYLAGGNVMGVIHAIIAAHRAGIDLDFDRAAAIDLAGRDVVDAVRTSVYPKVIDCPDPKRSGKTTLRRGRNGVELKFDPRDGSHEPRPVIGGRPRKRSSPASAKGS
jgi:uncharacterized protein YqfA (UPF0365 family)